MDKPDEIHLNYLVNNPLVAIYNAEPTWQSGFLKVGHHLISVALGLAWLMIRLILMLFVWIWNNFTYYFPLAQLPDAEQWPAAFGRGLLKLKNFPILSNPRIWIFLLVTLAIIYILISLNMEFCWRFIAILQNGRAGSTIPGSDTRTAKDRPALSSNVPPVKSGIKRIFAAVELETFYHYIVDKATSILTAIHNINNAILRFLTSQGLKVVAVTFIGLVLACRAYLWMGDPMAILVEPNYREWGSFSTAIRLCLYRAKSWDFLVNATYLNFAVKEYGFKRILIPIGSLLALFVAYLAQAMSFMDRQSEEWQRAAQAEPQSAIPEDEGLVSYVSGLMMTLPFLYLLSRQARKAYRQWLLVPQGRFKATVLALIMIIPNLVVAASNWVSYYLGYRPSTEDSPLVLPRRNSSTDVPLPLYPTLDLTGFDITPPRTPPVSSRRPSSHDQFIDEGPAPHRPSTPDQPSRYSTTIFDPAPTGPAWSESVYDFIWEISEMIINLFRIVGSTVQGRLFIAGLMFLPLLLLLAFLAPPEATDIDPGSLPSISGWVPRPLAWISLSTLDGLRRPVDRIRSALPRFENSNGSFPGGISPTGSLPFSHSSSWNPSLLSNLSDWVVRTLGIVSSAYTNSLLGLIADLEGIMGKSTVNTVLLATVGISCWIVSNSVERLKQFPWLGAAVLSLLLFLVNVNIFSLTAYLARSGFLGIDIENSNYLKAFAFLVLIRLLESVMSYRQSDAAAGLAAYEPTVYKSEDVTVIIPTKGDYFLNDVLGSKSNDFVNALDLILENEPGEVVLATNGLEAHKKLNFIAAHYGAHRVKVTSIHEPEVNLRRQFLDATNGTTTDIICYAHSNVQWQSNFLNEALKPFNDPDVGLVGVPVDSRGLDHYHDYHNIKECRFTLSETSALNIVDRVVTTLTNLFLRFINAFLIDFEVRDTGLIYSLMAFRESVYYNHYNIISASTTSDNGLALASAKCALIRTAILQSPEFRLNFPHEKTLCLTPVFGGMRTDAAHFITRKVRELGYKTAFQPKAIVRCFFPAENDGLIAYLHMVRNRYSGAYRSNCASLKSWIWLHSLRTAFTLLLYFIHIPLVSDLGLAWLLLLAKVDRIFIIFYGLVVLAYRYHARASYWNSRPEYRAWIIAEPAFWFVEGLIQIVALASAMFPDEEPEEHHINVGFKGNWDNDRGILR